MEVVGVVAVVVGEVVEVVAALEEAATAGEVVKVATVALAMEAIAIAVKVEEVVAVGYGKLKPVEEVKPSVAKVKYPTQIPITQVLLPILNSNGKLECQKE